MRSQIVIGEGLFFDPFAMKEEGEVKSGAANNGSTEVGGGEKGKRRAPFPASAETGREKKKPNSYHFPSCRGRGKREKGRRKCSTSWAKAAGGKGQGVMFIIPDLKGGGGGDAPIRNAFKGGDMCKLSSAGKGGGKGRRQGLQHQPFPERAC